jgi:hypothetical protein
LRKFKHPLRRREEIVNFNKKTKTSKIEIIKKRLFDVHGDFVKIVEKTFEKSKSKALFIDSEHGEFWAEPCYVITRGWRHPDFKIKKSMLSEHEINDRLKILYGDCVKIDYSTFSGTHKKCVFILNGSKKITKTCKHVLQGFLSSKTKLVPKIKNDKKYAYQKKRMEAIKRATPKWLSPIQKEAIKAIYERARLLTKVTGIEYHVDHIVPLMAKEACGLHVPWNLEVIKKEYNLKNNNKLLWWRVGNPIPNKNNNKG